MAEVTCIAKRWGSSLGVVIPKAVVVEKHYKEGDKITVEFKRMHLAKEFFGVLGGWKKSAQQLKDEARSGWD